MSAITVTKDHDFKIVGATDKDQKRLVAFRQVLQDLEQGELCTIDFWHPRNPALHGYHFVMLTAVFNAQEQFEDSTAFRKWIEVGAGHCDFYPGPKGRMVAVPKSISWDELDEDDFKEHHEKVVDFLRGPVCTGFLWGHLSGAEQANMIDTILTECEDKRLRIRLAREQQRKAA